MGWRGRIGELAIIVVEAVVKSGPPWVTLVGPLPLTAAARPDSLAAIPGLVGMGPTARSSRGPAR
jgi:hypothetical protein